MRTSRDIYKLPSGVLVAISCDTKPPEGATIYMGYDYINQYWVYKGKRDTRTIEELEKVKLKLKNIADNFPHIKD